MRTRLGFLVLLAGLCLSVLVACGDDDDGGADATTTTEADATTTTSIISDDTVIDDDGGDEDAGGAGGDEEFCATLEELDRVNDETAESLSTLEEWTEIQAIVVDASLQVEELYAEASESAPPELEQAFADLVTFAGLQAEVAGDSTTEEEFGAAEDSPEFEAGRTAVNDIDEYAQESCGFSILQGG